MSGDISRSTFHPEKHYSSVQWQQGRVPLDADLNEQVDIEVHRERAEMGDVVGATGAPRDPASGNFALAVVPGGQDLWVLPGHIYVEGVLVELESGATTVDTQPAQGAANKVRVASLSPDGRILAAGDWVELFVAGGPSQLYQLSAVDPKMGLITLQSGNDVRTVFPSTAVQLRRAVTYLTQPDLPSPPVPAAGPYLAYLDVWEREVTALEDPSIVEVALGGVDTCTRRRVVWQLKLAPLPQQGSAGAVTGTAGTSAGVAVELPAMPSPGLLAAKAADAVDDQGTIEPQAGYRGFENQLYRVQIFRPGAGGTARYVWSRNNAAIAMCVRQSSLANNLRIPVGTLARDGMQRFENGCWVELVDEAHEILGRSGTLVRSSLDGATLVLDPSTAVYFDAQGAEQHAVGWNQLADDVRVRVWDSDGLCEVPADTSAWVELDPGVQVRFAGDGTYFVGDYWEIPARSATRSVEWPADGGLGSDPKALPPSGIRHLRCKLGIVTRSATQSLTVTDCRALFPPLTDLRASDVKYDPSVCDLAGAKTVQAALESIYRSLQGGCCVTITPADNAQTLINKTIAWAQANGASGVRVCFAPGDFHPQAPLVIKGVAALVCGAGAATRLYAPTGCEQALSFVGCADVRVRDLYAEAAFAGAGKGPRHRPEREDANDVNRHLRGVIGFSNCRSVQVECVTVKSGSAAQRSASCVSVHNDAAGANAPASPSARVRACDFLVGHQQVGLLLVNVDRVQVTDNNLSVYPKPAALGLANLVKNDVFRARLRKMLLSGVALDLDGTTPSSSPSATSGHEATVNVGAHVLHVHASTNSAAQAWSALVGSPAGGLLTEPIAVLPKPSPLTATAPSGKAASADALAAAATVASGGAATSTTVANQGAPSAAPRTNPVTIKAVAEVRRRLDKLADAVILTLAGPKAPPSGLLTPENIALFRDWYHLAETSTPAMGSHGILVAGSRAQDVRVLDNTIQGAVDGVHVALSHTDPQRPRAVDRLGRVRIAGNTLKLAVTMEVGSTPSGIFVGAADSLTIEDNYLEITSLGNPRPTHGIGLHGSFGSMVVVEKNHVVGATVGVQAAATGPLPASKARLWSMETNASVGVRTMLVKNF